MMLSPEKGDLSMNLSPNDLLHGFRVKYSQPLL